MAEKICSELRVVPTDPLGFDYTPSTFTPAQFVARELHRIAGLALAITDRRMPSSDEIRWAIRHICAAWISDSIDVLVMAPLSNLYTPMPEAVHVTSQFRIEHLEDVNSSRAFPTRDRSSPREDHWILAELSCLIKNVSIPKQGASRQFVEHQAQSVVDTITAMRLCHDGHFGCRQMVICPDITSLGSSAVTWVWLLYETAPNMWDKSPLYKYPTTDNTETTRTSEILQSDSISSMRIALERFNWSFARTTLEDKVIDLFIALENTLLAGITSGELKYRLSLRGASVLAPYMDATAAQRFLSVAYDARSVIVHGGQKLSDLKPGKRDGLEPDAFVAKLQMLTRHVLRHFVRNAGDGATASKACEELDSALISKLDRHGAA